MSLGSSVAWRAMQPKRKKCERCGLYHLEKLEKCSHCGDLDDDGLRKLLESHEQESEANQSIAKVFYFVALLLVIPLILSFIA